MKTIWDAILDHLRSISTDIYSSVNAPASPSEIRLLEEAVGVSLPPSFREYLSAMNGQRNTEEAVRDRNAEIPLLGCYIFLSAAGILETWAMMNGLFAAETEPLDWVEENQIKPYIWRRQWIPFAECEGSAYAVLDCGPGKNGTYGQVFFWDSGMDYSEAAAGSFAEFSEGLLFRLAEKRFEIGEFGTIDFPDFYI